MEKLCFELCEGRGGAKELDVSLSNQNTKGSEYDEDKEEPRYLRRYR